MISTYGRTLLLLCTTSILQASLADSLAGFSAFPPAPSNFASQQSTSSSVATFSHPQEARGPSTSGTGANALVFSGPPANGLGSTVKPFAMLGPDAAFTAATRAVSATRRGTLGAGTGLDFDSIGAPGHEDAPRATRGVTFAAEPSFAPSPRPSHEASGISSADLSLSASQLSAPSWQAASPDATYQSGPRVSFASPALDSSGLDASALGIAAAPSSYAGLGGIGRRVVGTPAPVGFGRRRFGLDTPVGGQAATPTGAWGLPPSTPAHAETPNVDGSAPYSAAATPGGVLPPRSELRRRVAYASRTPFALPLSTPQSAATTPGGGGSAHRRGMGSTGRITIEGPSSAARRLQEATPEPAGLGSSASRGLFSSGRFGASGGPVLAGADSTSSFGVGGADANAIDASAPARSIYRQQPRSSRGWCARVCGYLFSQ